MSGALAGLRGSPELVPGVLAVAAFVALAANEGGFEPTSWYPAAVFVLGLLAVTLLALGRTGLLRLEGGSRVALPLMAAFVAWAFASMLWAEVPADAWDGANRALLYLLTFALFALLPWRASTATLLLAGHSVAIGVVALVTVGDLAGSGDPALGLLSDRLAEPTGYHNATAALFLSAFFPALLLASRREVPWWGRGILLGAAGVLLQVAMIPQSRGSLIAFPIVALAFVALAPGRARLVPVAAPVALAAFLASGPLFDVYSTSRDGGDLPGALDDAFRAVALSGLALLAFGLVLGLVEAAIRPSLRARAYTARATGAIATVAAVAGLIVALNATGNPVDWLDERWEDFKAGNVEVEDDSRLTGSLGSSRYDFWRVALEEWTEDPVVGLGMDQFAVDYVRERESDEEPFNPHSFEVKILSQTGLVGALLLGGALIAAFAGGLRSRVRAGDSLEGAAAAAALAAFTYWLVHGSGDWFWEFPGLTMPALAWLAIASRLYVRRSQVAGARPSPLALALGAAASVAVLATMAFPWGAARDLQIAAENWPADPDAALERLDRAHDLNPLSAEADAVAGTIAVRVDDPRRALAAFASATERNGSSWYAQLMLGTLEADRGRREAALERFRIARELTPDDDLVARALERLRRGRPLTADAIDRELVERVCLRIGRTNATPDC